MALLMSMPSMSVDLPLLRKYPIISQIYSTYMKCFCYSHIHSKIQRGLSAYEKNTGSAHPSVPKLSKRSTGSVKLTGSLLERPYSAMVWNHQRRNSCNPVHWYIRPYIYSSRCKCNLTTTFSRIRHR
jgi:hypothetical protein